MAQRRLAPWAHSARVGMRSHHRAPLARSPTSKACSRARSALREATASSVRWGRSSAPRAPIVLPAPPQPTSSCARWARSIRARASHPPPLATRARRGRTAAQRAWLHRRGRVARGTSAWRAAGHRHQPTACRATCAPSPTTAPWVPSTPRRARRARFPTSRATLIPPTACPACLASRARTPAPHCPRCRVRLASTARAGTLHRRCHAQQATSARAECHPPRRVGLARTHRPRAPPRARPAQRASIASFAPSRPQSARRGTIALPAPRPPASSRAPRVGSTTSLV